ncbi:MAG: antirestriction protein ArdA [Candidatus Bathyarchaeota archaeon]|jgi:antirestriction protein|nr:antirestriction protein ArdA [Candidatus Termiticorpusculum sp.]
MCEQNFSKQINPQIRVYVANLSKYVEGELVGEWLNLPATHNEIKNFLKNKVRLNKTHEEYAIHDYESDFRFGEYENIYDLNLLAVKLEQMSENEKNVTIAYCSANGLRDTLSILNVCEQASEIAYVTIDANDCGSKEEKLGYAMLEEIDTDLKATLEQCKIGTNLNAYTYFDFEAYGRDTEINEGYFANEEIFIFYTTDIDHNLYTIQEIKEKIDDPRLEET